MHLTKLAYTQHQGKSDEWSIEEFPLGLVTLLVGKNATGKSRTLTAISSLATLLYRGRVSDDGRYHAVFSQGMDFNLDISSGRVTYERLSQAGTVLLERSDDGKGWVRGVDLPQLKFGLADNQLAVFVKRDSLQHPFLEELFQWGENLRHYRFGEPLGKDSVAVLIDTDEKTSESAKRPKVDSRDPQQVVALFAAAQKADPAFADGLVSDMNAIGYDLEKVYLEQVATARFAGLQFQMPGPISALAVKERALKCSTPQFEISQGMFRALSILIHMNFAVASQVASTVVLDDIGEGLDFDRSTNLISLLMQKARDSHTQLVMSTNDRYVMNSVPLESWAVILRDGSQCRILNYLNSREHFDNFELTGLTNFDFFRMEYWNGEVGSDHA